MRKGFTSSGMIGLLFMLWVLSFAATVHAKTFKIATIAPDGTTWMKELRAGAKEIKERTEGRVKFKFYPGGVMGDTSTVLKKMRVGQLQGGAFTGAELSRVYDGTQIYSLPLLFNSYDEVDYLREKMDQKLIDGLANNGMVALGISDGGFAYMMGDKPLMAINDLKGQKVWAPEGDVITQAVFSEAGIATIPLPVADVYTGLQTGLINTVAGIPTGVIAFQWHTSISHLTDVPLMFLSGFLTVDSKHFSRLKPADQAVVKEVMARKFRDLDKANRKDNENARSALQGQGIKFIRPEANQLASWNSLAERTLKKLVDEGTFSSDLVDTVLGHLEAYRSRSATAN